MNRMSVSVNLDSTIVRVLPLETLLGPAKYITQNGKRYATCVNGEPIGIHFADYQMDLCTTQRSPKLAS